MKTIVYETLDRTAEPAAAPDSEYLRGLEDAANHLAKIGEGDCASIVRGLAPPPAKGET
jgi:hypothetical protein